MEYRDKYIKYKNKYLVLKNIAESLNLNNNNNHIQHIIGGSKKNSKKNSRKNSRKNILKRQDTNKVYLALLEWLDANIVKSILEPLGYRAITFEEAQKNYNTKEKCVDLLIVAGEFNSDKRLYNFPAHMKSRINSKTLNNKIELHKFINDNNIKNVTADTIIVNANTKPVFPKEGVWIWRPEGGFAGRGVHVVDSQESLDNIWNTHHSKHPRHRGLLSRYIMNPLLTKDGYKFHVRINLIVVATPEGKRAAIYKGGEIITAFDPYIPTDFSNKNIHDSHGHGRVSKIYPDDFPGDAKLIKSFDTQVIELLKEYFDMAWDDIKWYSESDAAYGLFGCDFMMDDTGRVYLIEINSKPGFDKSTLPTLTKSIIGGIVEFALNKPQGKSGTELKNLIIVATND
jgi:hypothetical protein